MTKRTIETLVPLCSLHRKECEAPLNGSSDCIGACELQQKITQKSQKCNFFRKLFRSQWQVLKSLRSTLRAPRTSQEYVLKLSETFRFRPFLDKKCQDPELQRNIPNIKRSNFEAFPPPICSIFPKEFERSTPQ